MTTTVSAQVPPEGVEPGYLALFIPDPDGLEILELEATRSCNERVQACRLRFVLTVGGEPRAEVTITGSGDYDSVVARVEVAHGRIRVGNAVHYPSAFPKHPDAPPAPIERSDTVTLYIHGNGRLYLDEVVEFLGSRPWIELVYTAPPARRRGDA